MTVPENLLSPADSEKPVSLHIRPCFCGTFQLPGNHDSASPAYFIEVDSKVSFQKDIFIKMHHHVRLQQEDDCDNMVFLSANANPEYVKSRPVYPFRNIPECKGVFRPGDQIGEISLRHFSFVKACKRKREQEDSSSEPEDTKRQRCEQVIHMFVVITYYYRDRKKHFIGSVIFKFTFKVKTCIQQGSIERCSLKEMLMPFSVCAYFSHCT